MKRADLGALRSYGMRWIKLTVSMMFTCLAAGIGLEVVPHTGVSKERQGTCLNSKVSHGSLGMARRVARRKTEAGEKC